MPVDDHWTEEAGNVSGLRGLSPAARRFESCRRSKLGSSRAVTVWHWSELISWATRVAKIKRERERKPWQSSSSRKNRTWKELPIRKWRWLSSEIKLATHFTSKSRHIHLAPNLHPMFLLLGKQKYARGENPPLIVSNTWVQLHTWLYGWWMMGLRGLNVVALRISISYIFFLFF